MKPHNAIILLLSICIGCILLYLVLPPLTPQVLVISNTAQVNIIKDGFHANINTTDHSIKDALHITIMEVPQGTDSIGIYVTPVNTIITTRDISKKANAIIYTTPLKKVPAEINVPLTQIKKGIYKLRISAIKSQREIVTLEKTIEIVSSI